ncbi:hypothetical protein STEG23_001036, partial [Scotinomys teguina]
EDMIHVFDTDSQEQEISGGRVSKMSILTQREIIVTPVNSDITNNFPHVSVAGQGFDMNALPCTALKASDKHGINSYENFVGITYIDILSPDQTFQSFLFSTLSHVNHAEDLASKLLQCSPKNRLSAQAALSHEYFSDLPPRLWELTDNLR